MKTLNAFFLLFFVSVGASASTNDWSNKIYIKSIEAHSKTYETVVPHRSGEVWLFPQDPIVWHRGLGCKSDAVVIDKNDSVLLSMALSAMSAKQQVVVYVDSSNTQQDSYCLLRSLQAISN